MPVMSSFVTFNSEEEQQKKPEKELFLQQDKAAGNINPDLESGLNPSNLGGMNLPINVNLSSPMLRYEWQNKALKHCH